MTSLVAEARASARAPEHLLARFRDHMAGYGMPLAGPIDRSSLLLPGSTALLRLEAGAVLLRIESGCPDRLADARNIVSHHLDAAASGEALGIVWSGDGAVAPDARPHNFRALRVVGFTDVTPRMRRLTLAGERLKLFESDQMHVKILIPAEGEEPVWPRVSPSGQPVLDGCNLTRRTYTIRRVNAAAGTLEMDFVLHGEESPGSRFASRARPGDWLGIMGPGGGGAVCGEGWTLLAGDETALPAIGRTLETMDSAARGLVLIEVADEGEVQDLAHPPGMVVRWLPRDGAPYGNRLLEAACAAAWPDEPVTCWAACENMTARALRDHWGGTRGLDRGRFRAVAYWRHGVGDGEG